MSAPGKVRPSGFLYLIPLFLLIGGGVAAIVAIVSGFNAYSTTIEDFARVDVGDSRTIEIDGTGGYTVFYEPGVSDESTLEENDPRPTVTLTDPAGNPVALTDYDSLGTYGSSGYVGIAIDTFQVPQSGRYQLATSDQVLGGTIAVGRSPFHKIATGGLQAVLFGFGGFVLALVITILLAVSRGRSKRRIRAANPVVPAWTAQPGYPQPGYPPQGYPQYPQQPQPQYPQPQYPPQPAYPPQPQYPPTGYPPAPPQGGGGQPAPGGFGPPPGPPGSPPPPAPPPVAPDDDSTPGWGQPQQ